MKYKDLYKLLFESHIDKLFIYSINNKSTFESVE